MTMKMLIQCERCGAFNVYLFRGELRKVTISNKRLVPADAPSLYSDEPVYVCLSCLHMKSEAEMKETLKLKELIEG